METECIDDTLHTLNHPVVVSGDPLSTFFFWPVGTIKHEQGEKRQAHEAGATEEESPEFWVFSLSSVGCMVEPDAGVDSDSVSANLVLVSFEAIDDGQLGQ